MKRKPGFLFCKYLAAGILFLSVCGCETEKEETNVGNVTISSVLIPGGTFIMGSPLTEVYRGNDETQHSVTLSDFRMSIYEITTTQYADFLNTCGIGSNGIFANGLYPDEILVHKHTSSYPSDIDYIDGKWVPVPGREQHPVRCVPWYGASEFAHYKGGRLPTEAEWEYACRAEEVTPFSTGNCISSAQANYSWSSPYTGCNNANSSSPATSQKVGTYQPNAYGLYDMHGNVEEWCSDYYGAYPVEAQTNPTGTTKPGYRVIRGGDFGSGARDCRSANRSYDSAGQLSNWHLGFRIVLLP